MAVSLYETTKLIPDKEQFLEEQV